MDVYSDRRGIKRSIFRWEGNQEKYIQMEEESNKFYLGWRGIKGSIFRWEVFSKEIFQRKCFQVGGKSMVAYSRGRGIKVSIFS